MTTPGRFYYHLLIFNTLDTPAPSVTGAPNVEVCVFQLATLDPFTDRKRECAFVFVCRCVFMQPDSGSHTLYLASGRAISHRGGCQAVRLVGYRVCNTQPCGKFKH